MIQFPSHKAGLMLSHNQHLNYYETVEQYFAGDGVEWVSEEEKARAINTNECWELQWYPETPVGCYCMTASTLEALMAHVNAEYPNEAPVDKEGTES